MNLDKHFNDDVKTLRNKLRRQQTIGKWVSFFSLGRFGNFRAIDIAKEELRVGREDSTRLKGIMQELTEIEQTDENLDLAFQSDGFRISKNTFADIPADGTLDYPLDWELLARDVLERDGFTCQEEDGYCRGPLQVHHILELTRGGSNELHNLITLCKYHHSLKHEHMRGTI